MLLSRRRRHTVYIGDWSSDVCYSDLPGPPLPFKVIPPLAWRMPLSAIVPVVQVKRPLVVKVPSPRKRPPESRSEERRAGKVKRTERGLKLCRAAGRARALRMGDQITV